MNIDKIVRIWHKACVTIVILGGFYGIINASCSPETIAKKKPSTTSPKEKVEKAVNGTLAKIASNSEYYSTLDVFELKANDGCTYIVSTAYTKDFRGGTSVSITHSAACQNPKHKTNE